MGVGFMGLSPETYIASTSEGIGALRLAEWVGIHRLGAVERRLGHLLVQRHTSVRVAAAFRSVHYRPPLLNMQF